RVHKARGPAGPEPGALQHRLRKVDQGETVLAREERRRNRAVAAAEVEHVTATDAGQKLRNEPRPDRHDRITAEILVCLEVLEDSLGALVHLPAMCCVAEAQEPQRMW